MGQQRSNEERVRGYLAKHQAQCPGCGYDLKGLCASTCPECGRALFIEDLLPPKPFARQWLAFRICVWTIWAACTAVVVYILVDAMSLGVHVHWRAWNGLGMLLVGAIFLTKRARQSYEKNRWPEFVRWLSRSAAIWALALAALALLLYALLSLIP